MSLLALYSVLATHSTGPTVAMLGILLTNSRSSGVCKADVKLGSDGDVYESDNTGAFGASTDTWLDAGSNTQVWVERTISTGTLSTDGIGAGRVAMTSDRTIGVTRSTSGSKQATGNFRFYDAASGGTLLHTATWDITATIGGGGGGL